MSRHCGIQFDGYPENPCITDETAGSSTYSGSSRSDGLNERSKIGSSLGIDAGDCFRHEGFMTIMCENPAPRASTHGISSYDATISQSQVNWSPRKVHSGGFVTSLNPTIPSRLNSVATIGNELKDNSPDNSDPKDGSSVEPKASRCQWLSFHSICLNSLWMLLYHLVFFMGTHATLLASRIHGSIALNAYSLETCAHLRDKFPLGMWSPRLGHQLISESTFFLTYMSCTTFELVLRKSSDASYLRNIFSLHYFKERVWVGITRLILQAVIFLYALSLIIISIITGYGSPMQIVCGFSMGMLMLWINAVLTQLLELSDMSKSTMNLNWFWSLLSLLNFWICSLLFYISVYGVPFSAPYMYLQIFVWVPLLILTCREGKQIFMWQDFSSALCAFN
eukprot:XP_001610604.1 hypothetical protein [Babesia bovis T2Bo]